jgi:hypothetical protein
MLHHVERQELVVEGRERRADDDEGHEHSGRERPRTKTGSPSRKSSSQAPPAADVCDQRSGHEPGRRERERPRPGQPLVHLARHGGYGKVVRCEASRAGACPGG